MELDEPLTQMLERLVYILDVVGIDKYVASPFSQWMGRKQSDRRSPAPAFLAKAVYDHPTTGMLLDNLRLQPTFRRLCGSEYQSDIPSASTCSRAFAEFAVAGFLLNVQIVDITLGGSGTGTSPEYSAMEQHVTAILNSSENAETRHSTAKIKHSGLKRNGANCNQCPGIWVFACTSVGW